MNTLVAIEDSWGLGDRCDWKQINKFDFYNISLGDGNQCIYEAHENMNWQTIAFNRYQRSKLTIDGGWWEKRLSIVSAGSWPGHLVS